MRRPIMAVLAGHAAMGAGLGLAFALALIWFPALHVTGFIAASPDPQDTTFVLLVSLMATFGINAALTGLLLTMSQDRADG